MLQTAIDQLLYASLILKIAGYMVRDELRLRAMLAAGMGLDVVFYTFGSRPLLQPVIANAVLIAVNLGLIAVILSERTTWGMSAADRDLYHAAFSRLTPGQFRNLARGLTRHEVTEETELVREGQPVDRLAYVLAPSYRIAKGSENFAATGPAFVGEIALLTGRVSSATVTLPAGSAYLGIGFAELGRAMRRSPALRNAVMALFVEDLAVKTAASVPRPSRQPEAAPPQTLAWNSTE